MNIGVLGYANTDGDKSAAEQLLKDIRDQDTSHDFYYNCTIDSSVALYINTELNETMLTPRIQYDSNNINNKFVVSEIDMDYVSKGVVIDTTSKI